MASANNDDGPSDEVVSQFLAFTGSADASSAVSYLEMSGGDLETAVGLYMEHQQGGGTGSAVPVGGGVMGGTTSASLPPQMDDVRAPDATRTMRLMDDGGGIMGGGGAGMLPFMGLMQEAAAAMDAAPAPSAFAFGAPPAPADVRTAINNAAAAEEKDNNDDEDEEEDYVYDEEEDDDDVVMVQPPAAPTLQDMFAAPTHLIHTAGGFQGARAIAKDSRRWLLVNLQRDSEFSCHALNRDVWRDELVENLIREGFIFWQCMDDQPDGRTYAERYSVLEFPHVAILDPRTGRLMWRKEGWTQEHAMTAESFAEHAMDFCSRHSFDKPPEAPRNAAERPAKKRFLTEQEQLQEAMRASLKKDNDDDMDDDEVQVVEKPEAKEESKEVSLVQELQQMQVGDEPTEGGARIQIRMPDGKRLVRSFRNDQTVKVIYAFVVQSSAEPKGEVELKAGFPPKDLMASINETIETCALAGESINARWK